MSKHLLAAAMLAMAFLGGLVGSVVWRPAEVQAQPGVQIAVAQLEARVRALENGVGFKGNVSFPGNVTVTGTVGANNLTATPRPGVGGGNIMGTAIASTTTVTAGTGITATTGNVTATAGAVSAGTTVTGGTGVIASTGNISAPKGNVSAGLIVRAGTGMQALTGNIAATAGAVSAGTTVTAGTGITATTGNITATTGNVLVPAGSIGIGTATPGVPLDILTTGAGNVGWRVRNTANANFAASSSQAVQATDGAMAVSSLGFGQISISDGTNTKQLLPTGLVLNHIRPNDIAGHPSIVLPRHAASMNTRAAYVSAGGMPRSLGNSSHTEVE